MELFMKYTIINNLDLTLKNIKYRIYFSHFYLILFIGMLFSFGCALSRLYWKANHLQELFAEHRYFEYHQTIDYMKDSNFKLMSIILMAGILFGIIVIVYVINKHKKYQKYFASLKLENLESKVLTVKQKNKYIEKRKGKIYFAIKGLDQSISFKRLLAVPSDIYETLNKEDFMIKGKESTYKDQIFFIEPEVYKEEEYI